MGLHEHVAWKSVSIVIMLHAIFRILRHLMSHAFQGTFVSDVRPQLLHNTMIYLSKYLLPVRRLFTTSLHFTLSSAILVHSCNTMITLTNYCSPLPRTQPSLCPTSTSPIMIGALGHMTRYNVIVRENQPRSIMFSTN